MTPDERLAAVLARRRALWPSLAEETPCPADGAPCLPWCRQRATCPPRMTAEEAPPMTHQVPHDMCGCGWQVDPASPLSPYEQAREHERNPSR